MFYSVPVPALLAQPGTRNLSLPHIWTVSARQGPLPGQAVSYRHRTISPGTDLASPQSVMEV